MAAQTKRIDEPLLESGSFGITQEQLCDMFHPDNTHNYHPKGNKVSHSIYDLWNLHGGTKGLAVKLRTDPKKGISGSDTDIKERIESFGSNTKRLPKIRTLWELILENFEDRILQILLIAAFVALIIGIWKEGIEHGWVEGLSIFIAVAIIVSVTAGNNYTKEKQFQKLVSQATDEKIAVYRGEDGSTVTIHNQELLVGDIIKIESGMRVPADCILISGTDITCDESAMTGEPDQMEKTPLTEASYEHNPNPFLIGKTLVDSGQGVAIICAVGTHTRSGMAEEKLSIEDQETPLQGKLETIANEIGKVGVYVAILTFIVMTIKLIINTAVNDASHLMTVETLKKLIEFVIIAITIIVVAVPEGLPLAVTISLAFSVMKMKEENNLVRKLEASETMGGANEICTDKTGTLTKNQMTVREIYFNDQIYSGYVICGKQGLCRPSHFNTLPNSSILSEGVLFNCSARIEKDARGQLITQGNCTEQGLIKYCKNKFIKKIYILVINNNQIYYVQNFFICFILYNLKLFISFNTQWKSELMHST